MRGRRGRALKLEEQPVWIAPPPVLARFVGTDQRMVAALPPVHGGMAIRRIVATTHMSAAHTQPEVDPSAPRSQAVFTAVAGRCHIRHRVEMFAGIGHLFQTSLERLPEPAIGGLGADHISAPGTERLLPELGWHR
jgi:hypothetical protein